MDYLHASEVDIGHVVYLVEDTDDGPRRTEWCERTPQGFTGWCLGDEVVQQLALPNYPDGVRVEHFARAPGFRTHPDSWLYGRWLVIDTETTGLDDPRIVELGAVVMQEGQVVAHRSGIYDPGKPIHPEAAKVHGFTDEMVRGRARLTDRNAKTGRTVCDGLDALAAEHNVTCVVGYNAITFDLPILRRELGARWSELEAGIGLVVDPLVVVRLDGVARFWKGAGRHKLTAVAERFQLDQAEVGYEARAHRAVWDCILAGRILWHLREHVPLDAAGVREMMSTTAEKQQRDLDVYHAKKRGAA